MTSYANTIIVSKDGSPEDLLEGGCTYRHRVISCDVDPSIGTLEYGVRSFPSVPYLGPEPRPETIAPPSGSFTKHPSTMDSLLDEELDALHEDHGITIIYK